MLGSIQSWGRVSEKPSRLSGLRDFLVPRKCPQACLCPSVPGGEGEDRPLEQGAPTAPRPGRLLLSQELRWGPLPPAGPPPVGLLDPCLRGRCALAGGILFPWNTAEFNPGEGCIHMHSARQLSRGQVPAGEDRGPAWTSAPQGWPWGRASPQ